MAQWPGSDQNNYKNMNKIPNYALYGETAQPVWHESLHVEQISQRSGAHNWDIAAHRHDALLQLLYLQSGSGDVLFDSERVQACAPCVVYVPAQVVHGSRRSQQLTGFRELVDRHYREHRPLGFYASELGMTLATLGRMCQEHLGMTPMNVINARLVLEAKRVLGHSDASVKAIAHELGFADVGHFSRFFRKQCGVSPSAFRGEKPG